MTDIIPRLARGWGRGASSGLSGCLSTSKGFEAVQTTIEQIDLVKRMAARYPADLGDGHDGG